MNRILVIGNCGAGKSNLAVDLGAKLRLPVIHLDKLFWLPGWIERNQGEFDDLLEMEMSKDQWILDGNYNRTLEKRLQCADTVIFLDYSRFVCLWRVLKRRAQDRKQKVDYPFLKYVLSSYYKNNRPRTMAYKDRFQSIDWVVLKAPASAAEYLAKVYT